MRIGLAIVGLIFVIAGAIGLFLTYGNTSSGSFDWVQGNITYGAFTAVGVTLLISLIAAARFESEW